MVTKETIEALTGIKLGISEECDQDELINMFMEIIENLDAEQEKNLSAETVNLYNRLLEDLYNREDQEVKKLKEEKMENVQDNIKALKSIFKMWEDKGIVKIELPEEVSLSDMELVFLKTLEQMPFDQKIAGGYTLDIDKYLMDMTQRKTKKTRGKKDKFDVEEENRQIESIKNIIDSLYPNYLSEKVSYEEVKTKNDVEKMFLSTMLTVLSENDFCEIIKDNDFAKALREMSIDRKLYSINVGRKKRIGNFSKKWDGNGEPFRETSPGGKPSITYFIYNSAKAGKTKFADLEKKLNSEFGEGSKGPRDLGRLIKNINKKIGDFQHIMVEKDKVVLKEVVQAD